MPKSINVYNDARYSLTDRERQIWHLIAQGYARDAIAPGLYISTETLRPHRSNLYKKLKITDLPNGPYNKAVIAACMYWTRYGDPADTPLHPDIDMSRIKEVCEES